MKNFWALRMPHPYLLCLALLKDKGTRVPYCQTRPNKGDKETRVPYHHTGRDRRR